VIEFALDGAQASFDIAETLPERQLREGQTKELVKAGKAAEFRAATVACDALVELVRREVIDQLGEDGATGKHALLWAGEAGVAPRGLSPSAEVYIEKTPNSTYAIDHAVLTGRLQTDSRTAMHRSIGWLQRRSLRRAL
jgi:hypothetical protein